ncbi:MAG: hypothetical protein IV097_14705 [Burkholderiaceae bacterium]|nr:hypothetical protein [Burkholderiaceae bacterium]
MANHLPLQSFAALAFLARSGQVLCSTWSIRPSAHSGSHRAVPGVATALRARSLALPSAAPGLAFLWCIGFAHAAGIAALLHNVFVQLALLLANHSIEGTNNGGSSLGFLSRLVPPSFAPHVKR